MGTRKRGSHWEGGVFGCGLMPAITCGGAISVTPLAGRIAGWVGLILSVVLMVAMLIVAAYRDPRSSNRP